MSNQSLQLVHYWPCDGGKLAGELRSFSGKAEGMVVSIRKSNSSDNWPESKVVYFHRLFGQLLRLHQAYMLNGDDRLPDREPVFTPPDGGRCIL